MRPQRAPATEAVLDLGGEGAAPATPTRCPGGPGAPRRPGSGPTPQATSSCAGSRSGASRRSTSPARPHRDHPAPHGTRRAALRHHQRRAAAGGWPDGSPPEPRGSRCWVSAGAPSSSPDTPTSPPSADQPPCTSCRRPESGACAPCSSLSPVALGGPGQPLSPADLETLLPARRPPLWRRAGARRATRRSNSQDARGPSSTAGREPSSTSGGRRRRPLPPRTSGARTRGHHRPPPPRPPRRGRPHSLAPRRVLRGRLRRRLSPGGALNDASPARFAFSAAVRAWRYRLQACWAFKEPPPSPPSLPPARSAEHPPLRGGGAHGQLGQRATAPPARPLRGRGRTAGPPGRRLEGGRGRRPPGRE